jgi:hypothetical protein
MGVHERTLEGPTRLVIGPAGAFLSCARGERRAWSARVRAALDASGLAAFPVSCDGGDPEADLRFGPATVRRACAAIDAVWPPFVADIAAPAALEDQREPALERVGDRVA